MTERSARPVRPDPRDISELRQLRTAQPELATAIDMQLALLDMQRRVQARVPLPRLQTDAEWMRERLAAGCAIVRFDDIPLDWTDFRLTFRQTVDILKRFETIEPGEYEPLLALGRDGTGLEPLVRQWYAATSERLETAAARVPDGMPPSLDQVFALAIRPFLARCAEALTPLLEPAVRPGAHCPFCGWEPDFSVVTATGERQLICGRCVGQWQADPAACPFCDNTDPGQLTSFATKDRRYQVFTCDACQRYMKAYNARGATRPVLVAVDAIATLPLDAAAMQRGYVG